MLSVQTLARRIRARLHDKDEITYDDEDILDCINNGVRFFRRVIANLRPALLMTEHSGVLPQGVKSITLEVRPTKIVNITAGTPEKYLYETEMASSIYKKPANGDPEEFFLTGTQTINFYPTPDKATPYTIRTIDDIAELAWEDDSPLLTEFDDLLVEYAAIRLAVGNEFDMTQEVQLLASVVAQIQQILTPPPAGFVMESYWA